MCCVKHICFSETNIILLHCISDDFIIATINNKQADNYDMEIPYDNLFSIFYWHISSLAKESWLLMQKNKPL
jgi:hypothetical protein